MLDKHTHVCFSCGLYRKLHKTAYSRQSIYTKHDKDQVLICVWGVGVVRLVGDWFLAGVFKGPVHHCKW